MRVIFGIMSLCLLATGLLLAPIAYHNLSIKAVATELQDHSSCESNGTAKMAAVQMDGEDSLIANVRINDRFDEKFIVDTGADTVIINQDTALRLGFHLNEQDYTDTSETADNIVRVAPILIESLEIGTIRLTNVRAFAQEIDGENLLGMSELKKLKFSFQNGCFRTEQ
jgi:aspartyl protease family protein